MVNGKGRANIWVGSEWKITILPIYKTMSSKNMTSVTCDHLASAALPFNT